MTATMNGSDLRSVVLDVAALVRGQDDIAGQLDGVIAAIDTLGDRIIEALGGDEDTGGGCAPPPEAITYRERAAYWRDTGESFGYPDCCIEAFIEDIRNGGETHRPDRQLHPEYGYVMCDGCARDPERRDRVAAAARKRRTAPPDMEEVKR